MSSSQTSSSDISSYGDEKSSPSIQKFPDWMANLPKALCNTPLDRLAIPGSHDSFSYHLDEQSPIAPGSPDTLRNLVAVFKDTAKKIVKNWSTTQSLDLVEQLECGIRYFDFRVAPKATSNGGPALHFVHGLYGLGVKQCLVEMNQWLDQHPKELIFIDFNHLYEMSALDHRTLMEALLEVFAEKLCPTPAATLQTFTLHNQWQVGHQVVVFYDYQQTDLTAPAVGKIWSCQDWVVSVWPNTAEPAKLVNLLEAHHTRHHPRPQGKFHVTQGVLTPTGTTILGHIGRDLKTVFADVAMRNLQFYLKDKKAVEGGINLVIADFVETGNFVQSVLELNNST